MRSRWEDVKAGDVISASNHLNKLGRQAFSSETGSPSLLKIQCVVEITSRYLNAVEDDPLTFTEEAENGLYLCKIVYHYPDLDLSTRASDG